MRTYVIGDIHGNIKALKEVLERCPIDPAKDTLITLGDYCDGHSGVKEVIDTLLSFKNLIALEGNHDTWFKVWLESGVHPDYWRQGGFGTLQSYCKAYGKNVERKMSGYSTDLNPADVEDSHREFFRNLLPYYKDEQNRVFVHGGYQSVLGIGHDDLETYTWDRKLFQYAYSIRKEKSNPRSLPLFLKPHKEIFVGHTSTENYKTIEPINAHNLWNLDTGAGWSGKLIIMDIDSKEYWQSDKSESQR